jgi:5,5'-dehydrodivanillate O-demethylase
VQEKIPAWRGPVKDEATGRWISSHIMNQDFVAWVGQGVIADRTKEHLGSGDRGVILLRQRLLADLEAIQRGEDPKGVIRDAAVNRSLSLPIAERERLTEGMDLETMRKHPILGRELTDGYPFQLGQPAEVRHAYLDAMGVRP